MSLPVSPVSTCFLLNIQVGLCTQTHTYMHTLLSYLMSKERSYKCVGGKIIKDVIPHGYTIIVREAYCDSFKIWISLGGKLFQGRCCYDRSAEPLYQHQKRQLNHQGFSAEYGTEVSAEVLCWLLVSQEYQRKARQRDREVTA